MATEKTPRERIQEDVSRSIAEAQEMARSNPPAVNRLTIATEMMAALLSRFDVAHLGGQLEQLHNLAAIAHAAAQALMDVDLQPLGSNKGPAGRFYLTRKELIQQAFAPPRATPATPATPEKGAEGGK